jgi:hypothetical protein
MAVPAAAKPTDSEHWRSLLPSHLQEQVDRDPALAKEILQMSEEHAPEMWSLSVEGQPAYWGTAIAYSDSVMAMATAINWSEPGELTEGLPASLNEFVEALP